ncbi:MAG: hypothetical protein WAX44_01995 [Minisyncoccia bacterium]
MEPEEKEVKKPIKSLRTYQGDVEEALSKTKSSAATIMIAEQKKRETSPIVIERPRNLAIRNKTFVVTGMSLLVLGFIVVGSVYYFKSRENVEIELKTKALIAFSIERQIPLENMTREGLTSRFDSEKQAFNSQPNSVLYLNLIDKNLNPAPVNEVLALLAPRMPGELVRAFEGKYMVGIYSFDTDEPFVILITEEFPTTFAGMLKWEKDMVSDLSKIFQINQNSIDSTKFIDETVKNKDLRVLKDSNQKTVLLYSFIDKKTLVITSNENIFNSIIGKYIINQQIR